MILGRGKRRWSEGTDPITTIERVQRQIADGHFQRGLTAASVFFAILSGGEAYFEHRRGSFNWWPMWIPIWLTPPMVAASVGAYRSERIARGLLPIVSAVTLLEGLLGFVLHLRGIQRMPGHFGNLLFNITMGPPLFAPLLFSGVGMLGLLASIVQREQD